MKRNFLVFLLALIPLSLEYARGEVMLSALTSFSGDGWLSPGESTQLQGASVQRGFAYDAVSDRIYLVDRNGGTNVRVLNGTTGSFISSLDTTGVSGGTFALNMVGVGGDGAIYAGNLSTSAAGAFSVYRWANTAAAPTVAFTGTTGFSRTGDTFAVTGSGANTRIITSGSGSTGIASFSTVDGTAFTQATSSPVTGPPAGAFNLGLDFIDPNTAIGKTTSLQFFTANLTTNAGTTFNTGLIDANERPLAFYAPQNLLATVQTNSSLVRLYNASDLNSLQLISSLNLTSSLPFVANTNATGALAFGMTGAGDLRLYALNTNNGIQAFTISAVPEPGSIALVALGVVGIVARRRQLFVGKQVS